MSKANTTQTQGTVSFVGRLVRRLAPGFAVQMERLDELSRKSDVIIESYSGMACEIKKQVDEDPYSMVMNHESARKKH